MKICNSSITNKETNQSFKLIMKKSPITRITAGILGIASAATLGVAQEAQAGRVEATASLTAEDVTVELTDITGTTSVIPLFFDTVNGSAFVGPFPGKIGPSDSDAYANGPVQCPVDLAGAASANVPNGFTNTSSSVNCVTNIATVSAIADTAIDGDGSSNGIGAYTIFSDEFTVAAGDFLDFDGIANILVHGIIEEYEPGKMKTAAADFLGTYEIFLDGDLVFAGPELDFAVALVNQNGEEDIILEDIDFDDLGVDYTFEAGGQAEIQFSARSQVSTSSMQGVPEPSAVISLAAVGVGALVSRNKRKNSAK